MTMSLSDNALVCGSPLHGGRYLEQWLEQWGNNGHSERERGTYFHLRTSQAKLRTFHRPGLALVLISTLRVRQPGGAMLTNGVINEGS